MWYAKTMKKLNFGCGSIQPQGWDNVDSDISFAPAVNPGNYFSSTQDLPDNTYDIIVAHCSLQMVEWHDLVSVLKDLHRLLAAGGVLRISLPDIVAGFESYQNGEIYSFPNSEENIDDRFSAWLTWYSTSKTLLTEGALINKLHEAGFNHVAPTSYNLSILHDKPDVSGRTIVELDTRQFEVYFVEAVK